jgi:hypothetical protein
MSVIGNDKAEMDIERLSEPFQKLVCNELAEGERVLWARHPLPRFPWMFFMPLVMASRWTFRLSVVVAALSAGVMELPDFLGGVRHLGTSPAIWILLGSPVVLLLIAGFSSPLWMHRRLRAAAARTVYAITDRRAIIFDGGFARGSLPGLVRGVVCKAREIEVRSYAADELGAVQCKERKNGSGDLFFHCESPRKAIRRRRNRIGFFSTPDVKTAQELLQSLSGVGQS